MASDTDIAWAAGLIEGEGCFTLHSKYHPYFLLDMCDLDVLQKFQSIFPEASLRGPYYHKDRPTQKARWRVDAFGPKCITIMTSVLPYMGLRRREKINELLTAFQNKAEESLYGV